MIIVNILVKNLESGNTKSKEFSFSDSNFKLLINELITIQNNDDHIRSHKDYALLIMRSDCIYHFYYHKNNFDKVNETIARYSKNQWSNK